MSSRGRNKGDFREVRKDSPCPVCEKTDWCVVSGDGMVAICMRVEGGDPKAFKSGDTGWLYRLDGLDIKPPERSVERNKTKKVSNCLLLARQMAMHPEASRKRQDVSRELGVSLKVIEDMMVGVGWDEWKGREFASFPCWGADGKCRGIIMRYPGGKKLTVPGTSNSGVFVPRYWWLRPGSVFIVEGGSDVAALTTCNLPSIGRPSNVGGVKIIASMLKRRKMQDREIIVVVELDEKDHDLLPENERKRHDPNCDGCRVCWPGLYGAQRACEELTAAGFESRWVLPVSGCKDSRDMLNKGRVEEWLSSVKPRGCFYSLEMT